MHVLRSWPAAALLAALMVVIAGSSAAFKIPKPHISLSPPHISIPHPPVPAIRIPGTPIAISPVGIIPVVAIAPAQKVLNKVTDAVNTTANATVKVAVSAGANAIAPDREILKIVAGKESLGQAGKNLVESEGQQVATIGEAIADTNKAVAGVEIVAAESIGGNVGKTTMTIVTGATSFTVDLATTAAIESGEIMQGKIAPEDLVAEPLAAAIRAAIAQYKDIALPVPEDVKARLAPFYPAAVLNNARWVVGSISITIPDLVNQARKEFQGVDNAVTVGNITVFVRDPAGDLHWWAHEMQHQVQYSQWSVDKFAYNYVTSCHSIETEAENKAQQVAPLPAPVGLAC
jgi:hypothetical protein